MPTATFANDAFPMVLPARRAAELMTSNPVSIHATASVAEAVDVLLNRAINAAPVIDEAGHPIGVLSTTDLLVHEREQGRRTPFPADTVDRTLVRDIMTPAVFSVPLDAPAARVVRELLELRVHHLFVTDPTGVLVGVISAQDVLRHLRLG
jgi:CBS domain-containing protein